MFHPRGRRRDELDPQLVRRGGHDLQGRFGLRHQPVDDPLLEGASEVGWHRIRPRLLHAWCRCFRRNDQVGWRHSSCRQDGRAERRPPRRQRLHLVQGARGAEGACTRARPASTWTSTARTSHSIQYQNANNSVRVTDEFMQAVVEDNDVGPQGRDERRDDRDGQGSEPCSARSRKPHGSVPTPACSTTRRSRLAHVPELGPDQRLQPVLASTCTSTTPPATWHR